MSARVRRRSLRGLFCDEPGYSLLEVMVAIVILAGAIIPMVGVFGAALEAARASGDYDEARALANLKLEKARNLPYGAQAGSSWKPYAGSGGEGFEYRVEKRYLRQPPTGSEDDPASPVEDIEESPGGADTGVMKITVTVRWGGGNAYDASGVVAR